MYLERLLQINMATLAALGALLVGMGQRSVALPLLVSAGAMAAAWLTDIRGVFRLSRPVANFIVVLAVLACVPQLRQFGKQAQIEGIGNMLICMQMILLFQRKDAVTYWVLIIVSLLQVVVAAAFTQGVWFGVLLIGYMLLGLAALTLLFLHRQCTRYEGVSDLLLASATLASKHGQPAGTGFACLPVGGRRAAVGRELFGRLGMIGLGTLVLTVLLFLAVPRLNSGAWGEAFVGGSPVAIVGFSDQVSLGELGSVIESDEEVMRVELTDWQRRPYAVRGDIYLRGAVLTKYAGGEWGNSSTRDREGPPLWTPQGNLVRQRIIIQPLNRGELFCIWPFFSTSKEEKWRLDNGRLLRPNMTYVRAFVFELDTSAFDKGVQAAIIPRNECRDGVDLALLRQAPALPNLVRLASRWIRESGAAGTDPLTRAKVLERQLHDPAQFQYTLTPPPRQFGIDPIEDFVAHNPQGHCEYFATALALMLRTQGIPSRVVVGYKCGEYYPWAKYYQVRQLHAHAWVEAFLAPQHLPPDLVAAEPDRWSGGGWLRLEPTPGADDDESGGMRRTLWQRIERGMFSLQSIWANYVVGMDSQRQWEAIYQPIIRTSQRLRELLADRNWWRGLFQNVTAAPLRLWLALMLLLAIWGFVLRGIRPVRWFVWLAGVARGLSVRGRRWGNRGQTEVEFYRQLECLLARLGLVRAVGQTQREFAVAAGRRLAETTGQTQLAALPPRVAEAFYQVRFGRLPLDNPRRQAVEQALAELAACGESP